MKAMAAAFSGILALLAAPAAPAQAAPPPHSFTATYVVNARGMDAGEATYSFTFDGPSYQATSERRMTGMARMMLGTSQDYSYSVRGQIGADGQVHPIAYRHQGGRKNRVVDVNFSPSDIVTTSNPPMGMGNPPATTAQKLGAVDQVSMFAQMLIASGDPCRQTVHVYMDGRSRFDFVMTPNGNVAASEEGYHGPAIRCRVQFHPIAGFSDPQEAAELTFLFAQTPAGLYAPVRIEMPSDDNGVITLRARMLSVNGQPLH